MQLLYKYKQTNQTQNNIFYTRNFRFYKVTDKVFCIHITVKDLFGCKIKEKIYSATYSSRHQRYLERGLRKGKIEPIENFSTEEHPLYKLHW